MQAVVYGHSQAQPSGMGDDMVAGLKARGYTVKRVGLQGRNDKQLLAEIDVLGDISAADRVFLYCGGNSDKPTVKDIRNLITALGAGRTTVILPPVNLDRDAAAVVKLQAKNASNKAGIQDLVPVYTIAGHAADFKPDTYHMRAKTAIGKAFVQSILDDTEQGEQAGADVTPADDSSGGSSASPAASTAETEDAFDPTVLVLVACAALGWWLAKRRR